MSLWHGKLKGRIRDGFLYTVLIILMISSFGKLAAICRPSASDYNPDPVVQFMTRRELSIGAFGFQCLLAAWILTRRNQTVACRATASLGAIFIAYHVSHGLVGSAGCGCLPRVLGVPEQTLDSIALGLAGYMFGAGLALSRIARRGESATEPLGRQRGSTNDPENKYGGDDSFLL